MSGQDVLILRGVEISNLLKGREREIMDIVRTAYAVHTLGNDSLPHSTFLRFPGNEKARIIALPAYIGGGIEAAGIKWIASFPDNLSMGLERASATLILNSTSTGLPFAIMEGSIISARRTAASAALAVQLLNGGRDCPSVGLIGCGLINYEILDFLVSTQQLLQRIYLYDLEPKRSQQFRKTCKEKYQYLDVVVGKDQYEVFESSDTISFATTALRPYVDDLSQCKPGTVVLNISLRDLSPNILLSARNVVDDVDHVCRAQTSVHLAEQQKGNRAFINCTIGELILGKSVDELRDDSLVIFSPFGLGILDIALAHFTFKLASENQIGTQVADFIPRPWYKRFTGGDNEKA